MFKPRKVQELEATLAQQEKNFSARLKKQHSQIQKVNDSVELSKAGLQTADKWQAAFWHKRLERIQPSTVLRARRFALTLEPPLLHYCAPVRLA